MNTVLIVKRNVIFVYLKIHYLNRLVQLALLVMSSSDITAHYPKKTFLHTFYIVFN